MNFAKIITVLIFSFISIQFSFAVTHRVTDLADGAPESLRSLIGVANPGDTLLIDVSGDMILNSTLDINQSVTILGPFPAHFTINSTAIGPTNDGVVVSANNVKIVGVGFIGSNARNYLVGLGVTGLEIEHCLFENKNGTMGSAVRLENTDARFIRCSFIANNSNDRGGAVAVLGTSDGDFINTTFFNNSAATVGSAVYVDVNATYRINHCTFFENNGGSAALFIDGVGIVGVYNLNSSASIFLGNSPFGVEYGPGISTTLGTQGANVFENGTVAGGFTSLNDEWVNDNTEVFLRNTPITDGFGLKYLPIMNQTSRAIDVTSNTAVPSPPVDCRLAPRTLFGDTGLEADAGPYEYTPFVVNNTDGGATVPNSLGRVISDVNGAVFPGPYLIEFKFYNGATNPIVQSTSYTVSQDNVLIHGYTELDSKVPGPNVPTPGSLTSASILIGLVGAGNAGISFTGQNCSMWGISSWQHGTSEVSVSSDNFTAFGCHFGVDYDGNVETAAPDLLFINAGNSRVGGPMHWNRNIFGNLNGGQGIVLNAGNGHKIQNNYIGFAADGVSYGSSALVNGIHVLNSAVAPLIGGTRYLEGNHFGPCQTGVYNTRDNTKIVGNTFGLQFDGLNTVGGPSMDNAVHTATSNGVRVGEPGYWAKNVITNFTNGIHITSSGGAIVENNFIGTDTTGNNIAGTMDKGIFIINSPGFQVGQPLTGGNIIAQGAIDGIHVQSTNGGNIQDNYIGLFDDGSLTSGGLTNGINLEGSQNINIGGISPGFGNIIAEASDRLIHLNNSSTGGLIQVQGNTLGFDVASNVQSTNPIGISVQDHTTMTVIGDISDPNGANIISNCSTGILVGELGQLSQNVQIFQNQIYNNSALGIDIHASGGLGVNVNDGVINTGNNEEIDYPEILNANSCDGVSNTQAGLDITMPVGTYVVEIYTNTTPDPSNHGEGETFLISQTFTTTTSPETVVVDMGAVLPVGTELTATLTKTTGGTSEFSDNVAVTPPYTHSFTVTQPTCAGNTDGSIAIQAIGAIGFDITPGTLVNAPDNHTFGSLTDQSYDVSIIYSNCQFDTTIVLTAPPAPVVSAGSDLTLCANNATVNLNGTFSGGATGLIWTGGGGVYSPSNTDPNATYTPTTAEITGGTLTLTAQSTGSACTAVTDNIVVTFTPAPTISAGLDAVICEGDTYTMNGAYTVSTGMSWSGGGTFSPVNTDPNAVYTPSAAEITAGTVTLTATTTGNGSCLAVTDDMVLTIESLPTISAGPDDVICEGQDATLSATATGALNYNWSSTGTGTFNSNTVLSPIYTPSAADISAGTVTLTLSATGTGACSSSTVSDVVTYTITPLPDPGTNGNVTVCNTDPSIDLFNFLGGTPDAGGSWTGPSATTGGDLGTFDPSWMSAGTYTYQAVNGSCSATATVTVTVNTCTCSIDAISATPSACDPNDNLFDITGQVTFTSPPSTGQLIVEDCNGNQVTFTAPFVSPINYTISNVVSDGAWCDVTAYFTDNATCTATSSGYNNPNACGYSCIADAGTFNATVSGASASNIVSLCFGDTLNIVSNGDNTDPMDITPFDNSETYRPGLILLEFSCNPSVTPPTNYAGPCFVAIHDLSDGNWDIVNNLGDGSTRYFVPITAYDTISPTISHTPGPGFCYDFGTPFQVTFLEDIIVTPTSTDISCFGANDGSITVAASNGLTPYTYYINGSVTNSATNLTAGDHYIEVEDGNGCEAYDTVTIIEPPEVILTTSSIADDTCGNGVGEVVFSASGGVGSYQYDFNSGGLNVNNTYTGLTSGTYLVYAQDGNGCNSANQQVVIGNYLGPDPTFTYADFCPTANPGPTAVNPGGTYSYGTAPGDGSSINANTGIITGGVSGTTYQVVYQVGPCPSNIFTVNVTATQADDPSFSLDDFCVNNPAGAYNITTPGGDFYFSPAPGDGATIDAATGLISNAVAGNTYAVVYETPNCVNTDTVVIAALANPVEPQISTPQDTYCPGDTVQLVTVTNNTGNNTTYNWYLNNTLTPNGTATPTEFLPNLALGLNEVYVEADSGSCSTASQIINIYLSDSTAVGVTSPVYACVGTDADLNAFGGDDYYWTGDYSYSNDISNSPSIRVSTEGLAQVEITDQYGCVYNRTVEVLLENPENCDVNTYTAFSPNGDGNNETWIIDGIVGKTNRVVIFNRWGQEIQAFDNYNNQDIVWDGTNKSGGKLPPGTYYYIIEVDGQKMSGWIQIVM